MVTNTQPPSGASGLPPGVVVFPIPDPGFDPETASAEKLAEYGIIPRPDPQSVLFHNWTRLFRAPVTFVDPKPQSLTPAPPPPAKPSPDVTLLEEPSPDIPQVPAAGAGSRFSHSENWSGGYIVPTGDTLVVQVAAEWTLPKLCMPEGGDPSVTYVCSTWVGLDGQRLYLNSSLPQVGVMQALPGTIPSSLPAATAFCQWWDRQGFQDPIIALPGLPVSQEDVVIASVWVNTDTSVICHLRNVTTGELAVIGMQAPAVTLPRETAPVQLTVSGSTAEWVLERPSIPGSTEFYPFPRFKQTKFDVWAAVAEGAGPPQERLDLGKSRLIGLYDTLLGPARTAFVSMPRREGDSVFELRYGGFNPT